MNRLLMLVLLGLSIILSACEKKEQLPQPTIGSESAEKPAGASMTEQAQQARKAFVDKAQQEMDALNLKLGELKRKAQTLTGEAKVKIDQQIQNLEQEQKAAAQKLDEMKSATGDKWDALKAGVADAVERFKQSFEKAKDGT